MTTTYGVLIPEAIAATNIDAFNRDVVCADDLANGSVVVMGALSTDADKSEVFSVTKPATGSLTGLWMIYSGDEIIVTDARYKGLDPDPRHFVNLAGKVVSAYKPQLGDIITLTADAIATSKAGGDTHIHAIDANYLMDWDSSAGSSAIAYKLLGTKYISLATGAIDDQRVVAYEFECVAL